MAARKSVSDRTFAKAMAGKKEKLVTSMMIKHFVESPFSLWCDVHAPASERDPMDAYRKYLFETGQEHEEETTKALFPEITPVEWKTPEEGFRLVLEAMADGFRAFHSAPIFWVPGGLMSELDIIEKAPGAKSVFGNYYYVVKEIKSAKNIRKPHLMQQLTTTTSSAGSKGTRPQSSSSSTATKRSRPLNTTKQR